ncbi:20187_t:CDS:1, partial [Gigaspora rosea]
PITNCMPIQVDSKKRWHGDPESFRNHQMQRYEEEIEIHILEKHIITNRLYIIKFENISVNKKYPLHIQIYYVRQKKEELNVPVCTIEIEQYGIKWRLTNNT